MMGEISRATMGRLPEYLRYLKGLAPSERTVSAAQISRALALGEVQVRKDLSSTCGEGRPKVGYDARVLRQAVERALGAQNGCEAVIVGAGRIGMALMEFGGFAEYGIEIHRAFDVAPDLGGEKVLPLKELTPYCVLHQVEIGIITVPPGAAQQAADLLIAGGVRAIWCFAPVRLKVSKGIEVQYENLALSLAHLHQRIITTMETREDQ